MTKYKEKPQDVLDAIKEALGVPLDQPVLPPLTRMIARLNQLEHAQQQAPTQRDERQARAILAAYEQSGSERELVTMITDAIERAEARGYTRGRDAASTPPADQPRYVRITLLGGGSYVQPVAQLAQALSGELEGAEPGERWKIEVIDMTPEEYAKLPDFPGH